MRAWPRGKRKVVSTRICLFQLDLPNHNLSNTSSLTLILRHAQQRGAHGRDGVDDDKAEVSVEWVGLWLA